MNEDILPFENRDVNKTKINHFQMGSAYIVSICNSKYLVW